MAAAAATGAECIDTSIRGSYRTRARNARYRGLVRRLQWHLRHPGTTPLLGGSYGPGGYYSFSHHGSTLFASSSEILKDHKNIGIRLI